MPGKNRERLVRLAARGMHGSGTLRLLQALSRQIEIVRSAKGRIAGFRRAQAAKVAIVCHHRVGSGGVPFYSNFDPKAFEAQIRFLRNNYRIVSLDELTRELDEGGHPGQSVAVTFDDGYRDLYTHAFPILVRYGIPATIYLTGSAVETGELSWYDRIFALVMHSRRRILDLAGILPSPFALVSADSRLRAATEIIKILRTYPNQARISACAALERNTGLPDPDLLGDDLKDRMLTWTQIREMQAAGICFGAHTMNHPVVGRLAGNERGYELADSKRLLEERLQRPVVHFAYPFGSVSDIDAETCSLIPQFGYRSAVSTVWGINTPATHRYLLRRIGGEEPSLPLFAARLRWLFLNDEPAPRELQALEQAVEDRPARPEDPFLTEPDFGSEVKRA